MNVELARLDPATDLRSAEIERAVTQRLDLTGRDASGMRLRESRLVDVTLDSVSMSNARFEDVVVTGGSWANSRAAGASFRRVRLDGVRLTGAAIAESAIRDTRFVDCRADLVSFRFAKFERVQFERCRLDEADFYGATFDSAVFLNCDLTGALWAEATFVRSEMRGCELSRAGNPERLRGVRMPWPDVLNAAGVLAQAVGIEVID